MKHVMKISTVAFHAIWGKKELNLQRMLDYIELAAGEGSNLVVFPEMALTGYDDKKEQPKAEKMQVLQAETVPGPSSQRIAEAARKFGLYVAFGLPERDRWAPGAVYNSACVCGPEGILGVYRKIHLAYPEPHWAIRGRDPFLFQTPWGPIGVGICYDSYCFPELMRYYAAKGCRDPREAYDLMYNGRYDLIISDIMMPEIDGFEFAETVRSLNAAIPILFLTARDDLASKRRGFRAGVDDYMVKPADMDELVLRVGALLRRANIASEKKLTVGSLTMNADEMSAAVNGEEIPLTVREFNILFKLLSYPRHTFSRAQLMDEFWGLDSDTSLRAVDVYITKLRDKFSGCGDFKIVTVHGLGYKAVPV